MKKLFGTVETHYLDGFQYKYTQPWEDESGSTSVAAMKLRFLPTSEGYYDALLNLYVYNYVDHLGNIRLSYADSDRDGSIRSRDQRIRECSDGNCIEYFIPGEIVANNSYYPFGMLFDHNNQVYSSNAYKYKYNGKELQETGMYDYGARFYMPDIGRWGVVDPLAEKYRRWSPYNYVMNNPIRFIDPDGRGVETVKPTNEASLKAIQNTLPKEDRQFVTLDKDGNIDREVLNSHKSTSGNYSNLSELVNSTTTIEYTVGNSVSYYDKNGNFIKDDASEIRYGTPDKGMHIRTGESADVMGTTLAPSNDKRTSEKVKTSTNNNLQVYTNGNLSEEGQAQNASHELIGGHALFYIRGETWVHQVKGSKWEGDTLIRIEGNTKLKESITKSIDETINNMK
ncbi:hypothetical protein IX39_16140 [Chryseobacterium formosense]|uniref:RHS repeat-associated core domain-containing protein n=1 Tax=Chryseobacterium formosense TaxID=236814 RepID=A0A085Z3C1_9FLAO|nr:RHS repeat-associated core domain-containing protein [Chryseobacterium formosense]KFE98934.1 hypothetical protein IX39_16140 [Chryseobacterium formosense]SFT59317.1 RHS repeat-associated core domain-containing protein [Chryseobacterium formosense]